MNTTSSLRQHRQTVSLTSRFLEFDSRYKVYSLLFIAVIIARALSWPISLIDPDEYAFVLSGREVMQGHLPYTTLFDIKPVGSSLLLALAMSIGGLHLITVRIFGAICVFATAVCLYELMRTMSARRAESIGAPILYIAFSVLFGGLATMTEIMLAPFTAAAVLLLTRLILARNARQRAGLAAVAGLAFGVAVCIKMVPIIPAATVGAAALLLVWLNRRATFRQTLLQGMLFVLATLLPTIVAAGVYLEQGAFQEWAFSNFGFMHLYVQKAPVLVSLTKLLTVLVAMWPLTLAALVGFIVDLREGIINRQLAILAYVWVTSELIASAMPMHMYPHYFLMMLPPLSILASRLVSRATLLLTPRAEGKTCAATFAVAALIPVMPMTWSNTVTSLGRSDPQREMAQVLSKYEDGQKLSLLILSYDFMADYLFTDTPLPGRVAIPLHLLGPQAKLAQTLGQDPLRDVLERNPRFILMDRTAAYQDVSNKDQSEVEAKLACCYSEVARLPQFWAIEPGTYHMRDTILFLRTDAPEEARDHIVQRSGLTLADIAVPEEAQLNR